MYEYIEGQLNTITIQLGENMSEDSAGYVSLPVNTEERALALYKFGECVDEYAGISHGSSFNYQQRTFVNMEPNVSVKSEYNRGDYEYYRPNERLPRTQIDKVSACLKAYDDFGIVRNIFDLMGDFGSQGIRVAHPNKKVEKFLQDWFEVVKGKERSNMFLNLLYRCGNVIVRRLEGKISMKTVREWSKGEMGAPNVELDKIEKRVVPLKYIYYTPQAIEILGGQIAAFASKPIYALKLNGIKNSIKNSMAVKENVVEEIVKTLPVEIQEALRNGAKYIILDQNNVFGYFYKKNDWDVWATPLLAPVLKDLYQLDKLKLADLSALDGVISSIRLWNLGHFDGVNSVLPTKATMSKLRNILANNISGGVMDLVWGPELTFKESDSKSYNFLGEEKYKATLNAIYTGLGIPQSLVGGGGPAMTNNYMSLKTLVERLEYGRELLTSFWKQELKRVQRAMGHKEPGVIIFDEMVLSDEAAQNNLLLQMIDRNILSDETVRDRMKINNDIEEVRIKREHKDRGTKLPPKAGQFHNAQHTEDMKKIALQSGNVTPTEVGVDLLPRKPGEKTPNEKQLELKKEKLAKTKKKGSPLDGRPAGSKDKSKRKKKKVLPKTKGEQFDFVNLTLWAEASHKEVSDIVSKSVLEGLNKKNLRMLTEDEFSGLEELKFHVFANLNPFDKISPEKVYSILEGPSLVKSDVLSIYKQLSTEFIKVRQNKPTVEEDRKIQISAYILNATEDNDGDSDS